MFVHIPLAMLFGATFGALVAFIAGALKAYRGVHEVITTIMLNSMVIAIADYLASTPFKEPDQPLTRTPAIQDSARIPDIFGLPFGFFIAIAFSIALWWLLQVFELKQLVETVTLDGMREYRLNE
jgi:simple sugar transport system permease protein